MVLATLLSLAVSGQVVLPGDKLSVEEAQAKARIIVVAKLVETHIVVGSGPLACGIVDIKHSAILKGSVEGAILERASVAAAGPEILPKLGDEYLFFIDDYAGHLNILKVLPRTEATIAAVKKAVDAKAKP